MKKSVNKLLKIINIKQANNQKRYSVPCQTKFYINKIRTYYINEFHF